MNKIINDAINSILKEYDQPYIKEFTAFINNVLEGNWIDDDVLARINATKLLGDEES